MKWSSPLATGHRLVVDYQVHRANGNLLLGRLMGCGNLRWLLQQVGCWDLQKTRATAPMSVIVTGLLLKSATAPANSFAKV